MKCVYLCLRLGVAFVMLANIGFAQLNWIGGDGDWVADGLWDDAATPEVDELFTAEALGRENGLEIGSGELSNVVNITGANVIYDPNANGDFRFKPGDEVDGVRPPGGILNITNGSLSMNSDSDVDGKWTEFDGDELNLDNATFQRTQSGSSNSGGAFIFGSWRSYENQVINVSLTNGSTIDNHGQLWFGAWGDNAPGLNVNMTINNGTLDLKGGFDESLNDNGADADLVFVNGYDNDNGVPKNEKYAINFVGPGSIKVGEAGIINPVRNADGEYDDTDFTLVSYQDLWNRGYLQAHGFSGKKGAGFNGFFTVEGSVDEGSYVLTSKVTDPTPIVWDGGDGAWNSANWNGSQTAQDVMGRTNGLEIGSGEIGFDVNINNGLVTYDPNADGNGDFRFRAGGTLNLNGGSLTMNTASDVDGKWTEFDGEAINIAGGTLSRTKSDPSLGGGAFILGSWRSYEDQLIEISLTEGGRLENDGQLWFGAWGDNAPGLQVHVTVNDGAIDLTGGNNYDLFGDGEEQGGPGNADLIFINGFTDDAPKDESYVINFTGPGSITVDSAGILNPVATSNNEGDAASYGDSLTTKLTYEDLWDRGILQANGQSGLDGVNFTDFFSTTGSSGSDDYMLTSLLGGGVICDPNSGGDLDGNGIVDFADFLVLSGNFGNEVPSHMEGDIDCNGIVEFADFLVLSGNFGNTVGGVAAVPEPNGWLLMGLASLMIGVLRPRR